MPFLYFLIKFRFIFGFEFILFILFITILILLQLSLLIFLLFINSVFISIFFILLSLFVFLFWKHKEPSLFRLVILSLIYSANFFLFNKVLLLSFLILFTFIFLSFFLLFFISNVDCLIPINFSVPSSSIKYFSSLITFL